MTLEEAKKEIEMRAEAYYRGFKGWNEEHPEWHGKLEKMSESDGLDEALSILEKVDEPVGNPDKLTLTELAHELRKIFKFRYLTVQPTFYRDSYDDIDEYCGDAIELWETKPRFLSDEGLWEEIFSDGEPTGRFGKEYLHPDNLVAYLDLGLSKTIEEMLEDGDFSEYEKCIVEVE